jgi:hypothetical protein
MRFFVLQNFNISKNNIMYAQAAKVLWPCMCVLHLNLGFQLKFYLNHLWVILK